MKYLEKIDELRRRTGVSYRRAKDALEAGDGDVVQALILLEEGDRRGTWAERMHVTGGEMVDRVKELIHEGNVRRIIISHEGRTLIEFPVTVGALGALLLPTLAALGAIAAMVTECTIEVQRQDVGGRPGGADDTGDRDSDDDTVDPVRS